MICVQLNKYVVCGSVLQRGHTGDGCLAASILSKHERRMGLLLVLVWPRIRRVAKTTAYKRWNCQVIRPANCCHLIPSNRFLDGFPVPSQFAAAKLTHYSTMPHRPSDSS